MDMYKGDNQTCDINIITVSLIIVSAKLVWQIYMCSKLTFWKRKIHKSFFLIAIKTDHEEKRYLNCQRFENLPRSLTLNAVKLTSLAVTLKGRRQL